MKALRESPVAETCTALAGVLAGHLIVRFYGTGALGPRALGLLGGAALFLSLAGIAWRSVFAADEAARTASEGRRPSSNQTSVFLLAALLSLGGLLLAMTAAFAGFVAAALILAASLLRAAAARDLPGVTPLLAGITAAGMLGLGLATHPQLLLLEPSPLLWLPPLLAGLYGAARESLELLPAEVAGERPAAAPEPEAPPETAADPTEAAEGSPLIFGLNHEPVEPVDLPPWLQIRRAKQANRESHREPIAAILGAAALLGVPAAAAGLLPWKPLAQARFAAVAALLVLRTANFWRVRGESSWTALAGAARLGGVLLAAGLAAASAGLDPTREELAGILLVVSPVVPALFCSAAPERRESED